MRPASVLTMVAAQKTIVGRQTGRRLALRNFRACRIHASGQRTDDGPYDPILEIENFLLPSARPAAHTAIATGSVSGASTGAGQKVVAGESAPALDSSPTIRTDRHDRFERANRRSRKKHQHP